MTTGISRLAAVLLFTLVAAPAHSATVCVNPANASCSATIQAGVTAASFGDTVKIANGFYNENVVVPVSKPGLTIRGGKGAVLDGDDPLTGAALTVDADEVELRGFTIRNGQGAGVVMNGDDGSIRGLVVTGPESSCLEVNGDRTLVLGNTLRGCGSSAVLATADDVDIVSNKISHCDSSCVEITGDGAVVERNKIHITEDSYLIDITGDDAEVVKNKLSNADSEAISSSGDDILISGNKILNTAGGIDHSGQNPNVTQNRGRYLHGENGIEVSCSVACGSARITKNRVEDIADDSNGISVSATAPGMTASSNIVRNAEDGGLVISGSGSITAQRNQVRAVGGDLNDSCYDISGAGAHSVSANRGSECHGDGIEIQGTGHSIHRNQVRDVMQDGIDLDTGTNVSITRNQVRDAIGVGLEMENSTGSVATDNRLQSVRLGICDEATGSVLSGNTTTKADLPNQILAAAPCPID